MTLEEKKLELINLYEKSSKHSNYQILPEGIAEIIGSHEIHVKTRYEKERYEFIQNNIKVEENSFLDIGGNTGYFTFELLRNGAKHVDFYEGNKEHSEFVQKSAEILKVSSKISVKNEYFQFNQTQSNYYDAVLLLNVLHHLGDDYGNSELSIKEAKIKMLEQFNYFYGRTSFIVFQLGFNWKGNRNNCLFENGTKQELIDFVSDGICKNWAIEKIGIAVRKDKNIVYEYLNDKNIQRDDSVGEFLNRPLFIIRAK